MVYDISSQASMEEIKKIAEELNKRNAEKPEQKKKIFVIGNKSDLAKEKGSGENDVKD